MVLVLLLGITTCQMPFLTEDQQYQSNRMPIIIANTNIFGASSVAEVVMWVKIAMQPIIGAYYVLRSTATPILQ